MKKAWIFPIDSSLYANQQFPSDNEKMPPPVVTDLDGDGVNEVVMVTLDGKLLVLEAPSFPTDWTPAAGTREQVSNFAVKLEASLLPSIKVRVGREAVALSTGYLDPYTEKEMRKQVVVVVTREWTVLCFDHNLKLLWESNVQEHFPEHDAHREVAVLITSHCMRVNDRGMVLVGGSTESSDAETPSNPASSTLNKELKVLFGPKDRDAAEKDDMDVVTEHDTHFSYYAFEGRKGALRWKHDAGDFQNALEDHKVLYPQHAHRLDAHTSSNLRHHLEVDWRQYRNQLLGVLPHKWERRDDTRLALAHFGGRNRPGSRTTAPAAQAKDKHDDSSHAPNLLNAAKLRQHLERRRHRPHTSSEHVSKPDVIVAHLSRGIEVIHLYTGRTLCQLPLGSGTHADLNMDGVIDHVIPVTERAVGYRWQSLPACFGLALTGVPPRDVLWNGSICSNRGAMDLANIRTGSTSRRDNPDMDADVEAVSPVLIRTRRHKAGGVEDKSYDSVFLVSSGRMTSYSADGHLNWHVPTPASWTPTHRFQQWDYYDVPSVNRHVPSLKRIPRGPNAREEYIVAVGQSSVVLVDPVNGRVLSGSSLPDVPIATAVAGDFNNDGYTDLIIATKAAYYGYVMKRKAGTKIMGMISGVFLMVIAAIAATHYVSQKKQGPAGKQFKRSTD